MDVQRPLTWSYHKENSSKQYVGQREGQCSCSVGDAAMYVFGGLRQNADSSIDEMNDLIRYDIEEGWSRVEASGDVPSPRTSATLACVKRRLFLFGGLNQQDGWLNDLHIFDLDTNTWSRPQAKGQCPSPRDKTCSAVVDNRIYSFGGFGPQASLDDEDDEDYTDEEDGDEGNLGEFAQQQRAAHFGWFNDLFVLDADSLTWSQPVQMNLGAPTPRAATAMCTLGMSRLFIFGGRDAAGRCNDGYVFDTVTRKWARTAQTDGGSVPKARSFHSLAAVGETALVFGGRGADNSHYNDLYIYDSVRDNWKQLVTSGPLPTARGCHAACQLGSTLVVYGGSGQYNEELQQCLEFYGDTCFVDMSTPAAEKTTDLREGRTSTCTP